MHFSDYAAIMCALVLALMAGAESHAALRASVALFLREESGLRDWVRSYELRTVFGPFVYSVLHDLLKRRVIERKETPADGDKRRGYPDVWYRWKP